MPPHHGCLPLALTSPTCQGYSFTIVSWPPTILLPVLATPQLQEPVLDWVVGSTVATLNYTPSTNLLAAGIATIDVVVQDVGGTANGGNDTTTKTFTITVNPVNDAPTFSIDSQVAPKM